MRTVITDLSKKSRKMLVTINNPTIGCDELHSFIEKHIKGSSYYYCYSYEVGLKGQTLHVHIFLCFDNPRYGNTIKKIFPTAHIDYCNGTNQSVRDYVFKEGKWKGSQKEDTKLDDTQWENKTCPVELGQGNRTDMDFIQELLAEGKKPKEILAMDFKYYRYENLIRKAYFDKRAAETAIKRNVNVIIHIGESGSGKSHAVTDMDEADTYIYADYSAGGMDFYNGESVLFMDEFRGQIPYNQLLLLLDGYKVPIHARYNNVYSLWNEVHITSVIAVEDWYKNDNIRDTFEQLKRRIDTVAFHWKENEKYYSYEKDMAEYTCYADLEKEAKESLFNSDVKYGGVGNLFEYLNDIEGLPFD